MNQFILGAEEGAYASIDAAIPFWDPFSDRYNVNDAGIQFSQLAGGFAIQTLATAGIGEIFAAARTGAGASNFFEGAQCGEKVMSQMEKANDIRHAFPQSVDGFAAAFGRQSAIVGGDGRSYQVLEMAGSYKSQTGIFTYIKSAAARSQNATFDREAKHHVDSASLCSVVVVRRAAFKPNQSRQRRSCLANNRR